MGGSSKKKDGESRREREKRRARKLEARLLAALESRLRDERARDADLLSALRAGAAERAGAVELAARVEALRASAEARFEALRVSNEERTEALRAELELARRALAAARPAGAPSAPAARADGDALLAALEERLRSARDQDLRHREALFGRAARWVGVPLALALVVLAVVGLRALADLRTVASAVASTAVSAELAPEPSAAPPAAAPAPPSIEELARTAEAGAAPTRAAALAELARRAPAHELLARLLAEPALAACTSLESFAPLAALLEPLGAAPAAEAAHESEARHAHVEHLLARALREPFELVALEGANGPRLALARRGAAEVPIPLGDLLARPAFQTAVDSLLRVAASQPTLAALHARVDRLCAPSAHGERAFGLRARLAAGAAAVPAVGAPIASGELELAVQPGEAGAPLVVRAVGSDGPWRALRFLERPERVEFRLVALEGR